MWVKSFVSLHVSLFFFLFLNGFPGLPVHSETVTPTPKELIEKQSIIYRIKPEKRGGEAFKFIYLVPVQVDVFWRFKTDFNGNFLLSNRFITDHRWLVEHGNVTYTETRYTHTPNKTFRWRTTLHQDEYRMDYRLENPRECGQKFHYGTIQLEPFQSYTKVTHIAYFDFFGAFVWVNIPFEGGMKSLLRYTARWEKETISRIKSRYAVQPGKK